MTARLCVAPARLTPGPLRLDGDDHAYLFRVRRLAVGDPVQLFDGAGREAPSVAVEIGPGHAVLEVGAVAARPPLAPTITVLQAVLKGERMDWCLEKLVEVGVDAIVPVETARTVVHLDDERRARRQARHQRIAAEAARQCGRADVPPVAPARRVADALAAVTAGVRLVADPGVDHPLLAAAPADATTVALLIGPEGGLTADEVERAQAAGFVAISLGATVLRAETAGFAAAFALRAARAVRAVHGGPGAVGDAERSPEFRGFAPGGDPAV